MPRQSLSSIASVQGEALIEGDRPLLIEPGIYELAFDHHVTGYMFGRAPKLVCHFRIVTQGPHFGAMLRRYYNVKTLASKPRRGGSFKVGWHSDFVREYATLFGLPQRLDRVSTEQFKTAIIRGKVATVVRDTKQRSIPEALRYSVITELVERAQ